MDVEEIEPADPQTSGIEDVPDAALLTCIETLGEPTAAELAASLSHALERRVNGRAVRLAAQHAGAEIILDEAGVTRYVLGPRAARHLAETTDRAPD